MEKEIGLIGLGKMGKNIALNLLDKGYLVVVFNRSEGPMDEAAAKGAVKSSSIEELVGKLKGRKTVWTMLPAGDVTEKALATLSKLLSKGDIV
ncbi:MAG: NAD(P)-binding domain-containing protein, partial [Candidatus Micrarchaeaceae archaeon]